MRIFIIRVQQGVYRLASTPVVGEGIVEIDVSPAEYERMVAAQEESNWLQGRLTLLYVKAGFHE